MKKLTPFGSQAKSRFTGKIHKVTIDVKEMKKADNADEDKARMEFAHKKVISDWITFQGSETVDFDDGHPAHERVSIILFA